MQNFLRYSALSAANSSQFSPQHLRQFGMLGKERRHMHFNVRIFLASTTSIISATSARSCDSRAKRRALAHRRVPSPSHKKLGRFSSNGSRSYTHRPRGAPWRRVSQNHPGFLFLPKSAEVCRDSVAHLRDFFARQAIVHQKPFLDVWVSHA